MAQIKDNEMIIINGIKVKQNISIHKKKILSNKYTILTFPCNRVGQVFIVILSNIEINNKSQSNIFPRRLADDVFFSKNSDTLGM